MGDCHFYFRADDPVCRGLGLGAAALRYIALGYAVLPLTPGGKKPHRMLGSSGGVHHATLDPGMARAWWQADNAANVGVATGSRSALCAVDLDVKNGHDGPASLLGFLQANGLQLPDAPVAVTPSGGRHIWLRTAGRVRERPGILPGVDVKGDGGYVVAPPSLYAYETAPQPGEWAGGTALMPYGWLRGCPCRAPAVPPWLAPWLDRAPQQAAGSGDGAGDGLMSLDWYRRHGLATGERNVTFYRLACKLYRIRGTTAEADRRIREDLDDMLAVSPTDCAGFGRRERDVCLASARRFAAAAQAEDTAVSEGWNAANWGRWQLAAAS